MFELMKKINFEASHSKRPMGHTTHMNNSTEHLYEILNMEILNSKLFSFTTNYEMTKSDLGNNSMPYNSTKPQRVRTLHNLKSITLLHKEKPRLDDRHNTPYYTENILVHRTTQQKYKYIMHIYV